MSGRTQRQRRLTDMGVQYRKQLTDASKRAEDKKKLQQTMQDLAKIKVSSDRLPVTTTSVPAIATPLPGAPVIRPPTFQYPPPPKDEAVDDLAARFGKLGGRTRRKTRKHKKRSRK